MAPTTRGVTILRRDFSAEERSDLLGGIVALTGPARAADSGGLSSDRPPTEENHATAVPYTHGIIAESEMLVCGPSCCRLGGSLR
jgi:hypothetical protein